MKQSKLNFTLLGLGMAILILFVVNTKKTESFDSMPKDQDAYNAMEPTGSPAQEPAPDQGLGQDSTISDPATSADTMSNDAQEAAPSPSIDQVPADQAPADQAPLSEPTPLYDQGADDSSLENQGTDAIAPSTPETRGEVLGGDQSSYSVEGIQETDLSQASDAVNDASDRMEDAADEAGDAAQDTLGDVQDAGAEIESEVEGFRAPDPNATQSDLEGSMTNSLQDINSDQNDSGI